ncbi:MAG: hypothetical protein OK457_10600 [Thaumarchaeota archaeon]|nr:hypothetical protein [Nitrososphaerota archaeon]
MVSSIVFDLSGIITVISISIGIYAVFWAFKIRKALFVRLYRNQALGMGIVVVLILLFTSIIVAEIVLPSVQILLLPWVWLGPLVLLFWINTSVNAGRRSDPLLRDTLQWKKLRFIILSLIIFDILSGLAVLSLSIRIPYEITLILIFLPFFSICVVGAIVLTIAARRSKDMIFRRHMAWFGIFVAIFIGGLAFAAVTYAYNYEANSLGLPLFLLLEAYCLYRSVKSLIPLNRLSLDQYM